MTEVIVEIAGPAISGIVSAFISSRVFRQTLNPARLRIVAGKRHHGPDDSRSFDVGEQPTSP